MTLISVYVLMAVHITHWLVNGRTLAPLELNEVMYTFELGIVTAGFIFMGVTVVATAIFGRFFCSWGCHILALQDLCAWILEKLSIKPRGVRSRLLLWIPLLVAGYMFVWPQVLRIWNDQPLPILHLAADSDGWASFTTEHFWRNLPSVGVALSTFLVCGFLIVYVLGTRAFCQYGCPYGAVFSAVDRIAPGRIRVGSDCEQCGACTAACTSHIRVHEEVNRYGMVVNPACMKDMDCVSVCPQKTLSFKFGKPSLFAGKIGDTVVRNRYDFSLGEDLAMAVLFLGVLVSLRGLYGVIPFFMSIAFGVMFAYGFVVVWRLARRESVKFNRWQLKSNGRLRWTGKLYLGIASFVVLFIADSAIVRYHTYFGELAHAGMTRSSQHAHAGMAGAFTSSSESTDVAKLADSVVSHLSTADQWGLLTTRHMRSMLADAYMSLNQWENARQQLERVIRIAPYDGASLLKLATIYTEMDAFKQAAHHCSNALIVNPDNAVAHYQYAGILFSAGDQVRATHHLREAIRLHPNHAAAQYDLGALLVKSGDIPSGIQHLRLAVTLDNDFADARYNLAVALMMSGKLDESIAEVDRAIALKPSDAQMTAFRRYVSGLRDGASVVPERSVDPDRSRGK